MEEIKLIMEGLASLGEGAKTAFIWWVIAKYFFQYFVGWSILGTFVIFIYKFGKKVLEAMSFDSKIKQAMGFRGPWIAREQEQVLNIIRKHKN